LQQFRENFDSLWEGILKIAPSSYSVKRNRMEPLEGEDEKSTYNRMFAEMIDMLITNFSYWFHDVPKLKFLCLHTTNSLQTTSRTSPLKHYIA
jgi:hypothetical protein